MDTTVKTEPVIDLENLDEDQIKFMSDTMIREGFIQSHQITDLGRLKSRWILRSKQIQVSAKDLKARGQS